MEVHSLINHFPHLLHILLLLLPLLSPRLLFRLVLLSHELFASIPLVHASIPPRRTWCLALFWPIELSYLTSASSACDDTANSLDVAIVRRYESVNHRAHIQQEPTRLETRSVHEFFEDSKRQPSFFARKADKKIKDIFPHPPSAAVARPPSSKDVVDVDGNVAAVCGRDLYALVPCAL